MLLQCLYILLEYKMYTMNCIKLKKMSKYTIKFFSLSLKIWWEKTLLKVWCLLQTLKNDCTNFNLKKIRTAPEKKLFFLLIISLITSNNSWNHTKHCFRVITQQNEDWTQLEQEISLHVFYQIFLNIWRNLQSESKSRQENILKW